MLLGLSTGRWELIAAAATVFNLAAMQWVIEIPEYRRRAFWLPLLGIVYVLFRNALNGHSLPAALFLYSSVALAFPLVLAPVRTVITRDYRAWQRDPGTPASIGAISWIVGALMAVGLVVATVLTHYDQRA